MARFTARLVPRVIRTPFLLLFLVLLAFMVLLQFWSVRGTPREYAPIAPGHRRKEPMKDYAPTPLVETTGPQEPTSSNQQEESTELQHESRQDSPIQPNKEGTTSDDESIAATVSPGQDDWRLQELEEASHRPPWTSFPTTIETVPPCVAEPEVDICENTSLPELVFVVGVSGSGHHLIKALLSRVGVYEVEEFLPFLHIYEPGRHQEWSGLFYAIVEESILRSRLQYLVDRLASAQRAGKRGVVVVANSFPMGKGPGMHTTGRPDLIILNKFHCDLFHLKFVVIRRHPVSSVVATVNEYHEMLAKRCNLKRLLAHRPKMSLKLNATTLPYMVKARILEGELMYIDQQIRRLSCRQLMFVDHDRIQNDATRKDQVQKLATFLNLSASMFANVPSSDFHTPSEPTVAIPPLCTSCVEKTLFDFFEMRQMMWPLMAPQ